jgi:phosphoribosylanthranilate isomerase
MVAGVEIKVCGLTTVAGAEASVDAGADYLGFNLYPKSPRYLALESYRALYEDLPDRPHVAVTVEPPADALAQMRDAGFARFQVHFRSECPLALLEGWVRAVGRERLWLAPKLPPQTALAPAWMDLADTFVLDTYDPTLFGGTGRTGDWTKFRRLSLSRPDRTWILSGGLQPDNVDAALQQTDAVFLDVNSGVESAPGVKDPVKLAAFAAAIRAARA